MRDIALAEIRLCLHAKKTQVRPSCAGLKFLGFKLWPDGRRLQQSSLTRFNRRLRRQKWLFRQGLLKSAEIRASLQAWSAHVSHANATAIRRELVKRMCFRRDSTKSLGIALGAAMSREQGAKPPAPPQSSEDRGSE